jgi:hypothetical protein
MITWPINQRNSSCRKPGELISTVAFDTIEELPKSPHN